jgi:hypothetical protein
MDGTDDAAFASDVVRRARVAGGIFDGHHDSITNLIFIGSRFHSLLNPA